MELITPDLGLLIWMLLSFGIVVFVLTKFAWKPILSALKQREKSIEKSLNAAEKAREEMAQIEFGNEKITALAKMERDNMLKEAKEVKEKIIEEAKEQAQKEAAQIIDNAVKSVEKEKNEAVNQIKDQIAQLSVSIAEQILKEKLGNETEQKKLIDNLVKTIEIN